MRRENFAVDLEQQRAALRFQRFLIAGLGVFILLFFFYHWSTVGRQRTMVLPPVVKESFWVEDDRVSASYLQMMSRYAAQQLLSVSPSTVDEKREDLLKIVDPALAAPLGNDLKIAAERLKVANATQVWWPKPFNCDEAKMSCTLAGDLETYINERRVSFVPKSYQAKWKFSGGVVRMVEFQEVTHGAQ